MKRLLIVIIILVVTLLIGFLIPITHPPVGEKHLISTLTEHVVNYTTVTSTPLTDKLKPTVEDLHRTTEVEEETRRAELWSETEITIVKPSIDIIYYPSDGICYNVIEILFNITGVSYSNPFNSSEINIVGYITTPEGKTLTIPAFYTKNHTIESVGPNKHTIVFTSPPLWCIRFTPLKQGEYRVRIKAVNYEELEVSSKEVVINVQHCPKGKKFTSVDSKGKYLVFDGGDSELLLGINLAWPPSRNEAIAFYKRWFERLKELGVKVVRIGLVPWSLNLEWSRLHRYNLVDAARIDEVLKLAKENDVYVIFVFMWHNELADYWGSNPYNLANGGLLKTPGEFWVNPLARKIFKDRVRYIIARWGYSPNILAWEIVNEADLTTDFNTYREAFLEWLADLSSYVKSLDPYRRPITVSLSYHGSEPRVWELWSIDFVTVHVYGPSGLKDVASAIHNIIKSLWSKYRKPVIVTEFGVDYRWIGMPGFIGTPYWAMDRDGVGLHEGLWSSILSGSPISAMSWWWDVQIEKYNLFYHFKALSEFLKNVNPVISELSEAKVVIKHASTERGGIASLTLYPVVGWIKTQSAKPNVYAIHPEGSIEGDINLLSGFIYGKSHPQKTLNPIFRVKLLDRGRVIIHVNSVGKGSAILTIYVNNEKISETPLPDRDGKWDEASNEYNIDIVLELGPGDYEIKIDNEGVDWFTWDYIVFESSVYAKAKVQVIGLQNRTFSMLWVRNKDYNWWNVVVVKKNPELLKDVLIELQDLEDGVYIVEYWDTYKGSIIKTKEVVVKNGRTEVRIDQLEKDIALKIFKKRTERSFNAYLGMPTFSVNQQAMVYTNPLNNNLYNRSIISIKYRISTHLNIFL